MPDMDSRQAAISKMSVILTFVGPPKFFAHCRSDRDSIPRLRTAAPAGFQQRSPDMVPFATWAQIQNAEPVLCFLHFVTLVIPGRASWREGDGDKISDASHSAVSASLIVAPHLRPLPRGASTRSGPTVLCCRSARTACLRCQPVVAHCASRIRPFSARLADR
jgi:hypothetical protein